MYLYIYKKEEEKRKGIHTYPHKYPRLTNLTIVIAVLDKYLVYSYSYLGLFI